MKKYTYEKNIDLMRDFFASDYYKLIINKQDGKKIAKKIIDSIISDPDACDELLYEKLEQKNKYNGIVCKSSGAYGLNINGIILGADCMNGWKALYDVYENEKEFLQAYEKLRSLLMSHLMWPRHRNSINTMRYSKFSDRVDYTLFDLKQYLDNQNNKEKISSCYLINAYNHNETRFWLEQFKDFADYIDKMDLSCFMKDGYIFDIETGKIINSYPSNKISFTRTYFENLMHICQNQEKLV